MKRGISALENNDQDLGPVDSPEQIAARPKVKRSLRNTLLAGTGLTTAWAGGALALSSAPITAPLVLGTVGIAGAQVGGLMLAGYAGYKTLTGLGHLGYKAASSVTNTVGNYFNKPATEQPVLEQEAEVLADNGMEVQVEQPVEQQEIAEEVAEVLVDNGMEVQVEQPVEQQEIAEEVAEVLVDNGMEAQVEEVIVEQPSKRRKLVEETETKETTYQSNLVSVNVQIAALRSELKNCKTLFNAFDKETAKFQDAQFENGALAAEQPARNKLQFLRWELKKLGELSETGLNLRANAKKDILDKMSDKISKASNKPKI